MWFLHNFGYLPTSFYYLIFFFTTPTSTDKSEDSRDRGGYTYYQEPIPYDYVQKTVRNVYKCYSCMYMYQNRHESGFPNCRNPFKSANINVVNCTGPCSIMYTKLSDSEYVFNRGCLPNCKESKDENGYTQCCYGDHCNSSFLKLYTNNTLIILTAIFALTNYIFSLT